MKFEFSDHRLAESNDPPGQVRLLDRSALFGDGFFTTGVVRAGRLAFEAEHLKRLTLSAQKLLFVDFSTERLKKVLADFLRDCQHAAIRISVVRCQSARGYAIGKDAQTLCRVQLSELPELPSQSCQLVLAKNAISTNPDLAGIKHLNRLDSVLAASQIDPSCQEALMGFDRQVISGSRSNVFLRVDGQWYTPKLDQAGVAGITRRRVMQAMQAQEIPVFEQSVTLAMLGRADAAFLTNSLFGFWPVGAIMERPCDAALAQALRTQLRFSR